MGLRIATSVALVTAAIAPDRLPGQGDGLRLVDPVVRIAIDTEARVSARLEGRGPIQLKLDPRLAVDGSLSRALVRRLRLKPRDGRVSVGELSVGGVRVNGLTFAVADRGEADADGVIGLGAMRGALWTFEPRTGLVTVRRGRLAEGKGVAAWPSAAQPAPFTIDVAHRRVRLHDVHEDAPAAFDPAAPPVLAVTRAPSGHLLVPARVDDQDAGAFVVDTGASTTVIDDRVAKRIGLVARGSGSTRTLTRIVETRRWRALSVRVGPVTLRDHTVIGLDLRALSLRVGREVAGIVGGDVFEHAILELDARRGRVALLDAREPPPGLRWSDLELRRRVPIVGSGFEGKRGRFLIDTGDPDTVTFFGRAVREHGLLEGREVTLVSQGEIGGTFDVSRGELGSLRVGGELALEVPAYFARPEGGKGILGSRLGDGILGLACLRGGVVMLDYARERVAWLTRERVWLDPQDVNGLTGEFAHGRSRCEIGRTGERLRVTWGDGAPADELVAEGEGKFGLRWSAGELEFRRREGKATGFALRRAGRGVQHWRRK